MEKDYPQHPTSGEKDYPQQPTSGGKDYPQQPTSGEKDYPQHPTSGGKDYPQQPTSGGKDYPQQPTSGEKDYLQHPTSGGKDYPQHPTNGKKDYLYPQTNNKRGQKHNHHQQSNTTHQIPHTDLPMQAHSPFQFHALQSNTVAVAARTTCSLSLGRNLGLSSAQLHLSGARLTAKCQGNMFDGQNTMGNLFDG